MSRHGLPGAGLSHRAARRIWIIIVDAAGGPARAPRLWGRAEGVRTALRSGGEAVAPLLFGYVSQYIFGGPGVSSGSGGSGGASTANSAGLEYTFLLFLGALLAAGLLALAGLRTYPCDLATAAASAQAIGQGADTGREEQRPAA